MEDKAIIDLYFERKEEALKATDQKYSAYLKKVISGILNRKEDIEECLNDTYMAVWNRIPPERPAVLRAFVAKIARYTAFNKYDYISAEKRLGRNRSLHTRRMHGPGSLHAGRWGK